MNESTPNQSRQTKFIVVDDEEIVLSLVRDALEDAGFIIELANGSREALEKIEKEYFDFILTDIRMPDCDGIELVKKAKKINPTLGVIFMTGYANLNTAKDAIKEGAYDYIMKPFELKEMRQAVNNAIAKRQKDTEKALSNELNRISDLNQLMYTVGDRNSLMRLSLGFAMMQSRASKGCISFCTENENEIGVISTEDLNKKGFEETFRKYDKDYFGSILGDFNAPFFTSSIQDHPLFGEYNNDAAVGNIVIPPWHVEGERLINIALKGCRKLYGFLILAFAGDSEPIKGSAIKFLTITANQIAISLENIALLEETRTAYCHLKDLQDQTIQLEKMAAKGRLSAEIGHELNNFLGVVAGNLSLMEHHLSRENYKELDKYLKVAVENLNNIRKFSDGLMDFSSLSASMEPCDVNRLIKDTIEYLITQNRFDKIKIEFTPSDAKIFTRADTGQLQQLLYNLIYNSADAVKEKQSQNEKRIEIKSLLEDENNFSITVSDNGAGISEEFINIAFKERFTTKKSGHGLGLMVCRRIIENHKGRLKIDSNPGKGTVITITAPIIRVTEERRVPVNA